MHQAAKSPKHNFFELTVRLEVPGGDGSKKVIRGHVNVSASVLLLDFQSGEISKNFVWSAVSTDPVLVANHSSVMKADVFLLLLLLLSCLRLCGLL